MGIMTMRLRRWKAQSIFEIRVEESAQTLGRHGRVPHCNSSTEEGEMWNSGSISEKISYKQGDDNIEDSR
jgi:hypothetical protein